MSQSEPPSDEQPVRHGVTLLLFFLFLTPVWLMLGVGCLHAEFESQFGKGVARALEHIVRRFVP